MKRNVYIIGSKGIPAKYGGFETFVEQLTKEKKNDEIQYYVACMKENSKKSNINDDFFEYNGAICFNIDMPDVGPAKAILYDLLALKKAISISKKNHDKNPVFYILACRIGPFIKPYKKIVKKLNGQLFINPDGHEWLREKWSLPVRKYWKHSEKLMVKHSDLIICDSKNIEKYIKRAYTHFLPKTKYISYGTELDKSKFDKENKIVKKWYEDKQITEGSYYLVVGRFVPENNYEAMIKEFINSNTNKSLVLICNVEKNKFYNKLNSESSFELDQRIKFVGTVYDQSLLKYIRENAFAYIHGHEVGGTNPSLLEAMYSTPLNLLLDVGFNREVGRNSAMYWKKNNLSELIDYLELDDNYEIAINNLDSKKFIVEEYSWDVITEEYEKLFKPK